MADMVNDDYYSGDSPDQQQDDYLKPNKKTMKHTFDILSTKTARKDGVKYLGKSGEQAWRVSTKIGEEWFACMLYDEALIPKKGQPYEIKLSENDGFKNWEYSTLSKKEQVLGQTTPMNTTPAPFTVKDGDANFIPPPITEEMAKEDKPLLMPSDVIEQIKHNTETRRELSIVTQSILHINGYYVRTNEKYSSDDFKANAEQALEDAKWFLELINKQ